MAKKTATMTLKPRKGDDTNYTFGVGREPLKLSNGELMGLDGLYREDSGKPLGVVSPKYVLTPHTRAAEFVENLLDTQKLPYVVGKTAVAFGGNRFFREYRLPSMEFVPGDNGGGKQTALDGGTKDNYYPTLIVSNSYDRSSTLDFMFGGFRLVCSNGMVMGNIVQRIAVKHIYNPDFQVIGDQFLTRMEANISGFKRIYTTLNSTPADPFLTLLLMETFTKKMAQVAEGLSKGLLQLSYDTDGNIDGVTASPSLSAYALFNIATAVSTHQIRKFHRSLQMQKKIAKVFNI